MPRRCYQIRLNAKSSQPHLRDGPEPGKRFRIPDLKGWAMEHRIGLLAALLTLARAWYAAGKPKPKIKPLGSFEAWTLIIGGILEFVGVDGFMANATSMYEEADDESQEFEGFLLKLHEIYHGDPFTVAAIMERLSEKAIPGGSEPSARAADLRSVLPAYLADGLSRQGVFQKRTGQAFAAKADRRFGNSGIYLKRCKISAGRQQWEVVLPE